LIGFIDNELKIDIKVKLKSKLEKLDDVMRTLNDSIRVIEERKLENMRSTKCFPPVQNQGYVRTRPASATIRPQMKMKEPPYSHLTTTTI
jgi:hypothetical protein